MSSAMLLTEWSISNNTQLMMTMHGIVWMVLPTFWVSGTYASVFLYPLTTICCNSMWHISFQQGGSGLFYYDTIAPGTLTFAKFLAKNDDGHGKPTTSQASKNFSKCNSIAVIAAHQLQALLEYQFNANFVNMVHFNLSQDCPITTAHIFAATSLPPGAR